LLQLAAYPSEPTCGVQCGAKCVSNDRPGKAPKAQIPLAHCEADDAREQHVSAHAPEAQSPERHEESELHAAPPWAAPGVERPTHDGATQYWPPAPLAKQTVPAGQSAEVQHAVVQKLAPPAAV
jgi:hypothetical protein